MQIQNKITEEHNNFSDSNRNIVKRERINLKIQDEELLKIQDEELATQLAKEYGEKGTKLYVTKKNVL